MSDADGRLLLALESSGAVATVAVGQGTEVISEVVLEERRQHAARLAPAVADALDRAGVSPADLGGVVVGAGPGSFTGVRVAAATAKGLCRALGVPLHPVSSLEAASLAGADDLGGPGAGVRYVLFDARGDRVYGACYRVGPGGGELVVPPHAGTVGELLAHGPPDGAVFVGEGADRHRTALEEAGFEVAPAPAGRPTARALLVAAAAREALPVAEEPELWEPTYLRASNAEREWKG